MKEIREYTNYRVEVIPEDPWILPNDSMEKRHLKFLEALADCEKSIKRHCDNIAETSTKCDIVEQCSYCKSIWTEVSASYNGGCCEEDERSNPNSRESI